MAKALRVIVGGECEAAWNMATDCALLQSVQSGRSGAVLRLYRWSGPAISVGYLQRVSPGIDIDAARCVGIPVVRRPTGGRAVVHGGDQTLALALPIEGDCRPARSVVGTYRFLMRGVMLALAECGVKVREGAWDRNAGRTVDCFAVSTRADLVDFEGRKIVGGAQRRFGNALLLQASIRYREVQLPDGILPGFDKAITPELDFGSYRRLEESLEFSIAAVLELTTFRDRLTPMESAVAGEAAPTHHCVDSPSVL